MSVNALFTILNWNPHLRRRRLLPIEGRNAASISGADVLCAGSVRRHCAASGIAQVSSHMTIVVTHREKPISAVHGCSEPHLAIGGRIGPHVFGKGLYLKPPDLRAAGTQNKSDGELYYTTDNGVRLSEMPIFSGTHTAAQTWRLVCSSNTGLRSRPKNSMK